MIYAALFANEGWNPTNSGQRRLFPADAVDLDGEHLILHLDRRADGVILEVMIGDQPDSDLIPKLVSGLQAHRVQGRWANTQDKVFVLLALDRYFQTFEKLTPDFVARTSGSAQRGLRDLHGSFRVACAA